MPTLLTNAGVHVSFRKMQMFIAYKNYPTLVFTHLLSVVRKIAIVYQPFKNTISRCRPPKKNNTKPWQDCDYFVSFI